MAGQIGRLLLAGANWPDRLLACAGALCGIAVTAAIGGLVPASAAPFLIAPMGASAVLVYAVPASPLAQPWPVIGGSVLSVLVGLACAVLFGHGALVAGLAVALAILLMSLLRCLHPPGGACALLPVLGGPAIVAKGLAFAFVPVALNAVVLVCVGLAFHRLSRHSYPHRPAKPAPVTSLQRQDIDAALAEAHESFDIDSEDLAALLDRAEAHAQARAR
ncbi:HPP family protein [Sphingomonas sp. S2-65]|uniref:HPP family protein n=1 Tax=Sphingomonas sp. S2-65 TaxID=2903960 RepID=UPI001F272481|nr:HPP family protein [Sphingomonas sp. S2-65]UYY58351.1 HPP family protein [Sphingomonas sp. S2-65]